LTIHLFKNAFFKLYYPFPVFISEMAFSTCRTSPGRYCISALGRTGPWSRAFVATDQTDDPFPIATSHISTNLNRMSATAWPTDWLLRHHIQSSSHPSDVAKCYIKLKFARVPVHIWSFCVGFGMAAIDDAVSGGSDT